MKKVFTLLLLILIVSAASVFYLKRLNVKPVRIGVIFSLSGTMSVSEKPLVDAVRMAVDEINLQGGVLGRPLEMIVADSRSDWNLAAKEAERLITEEKVSMLVACWTSACRKAIRPVVEKNQHLMFYPLQYEGMESSPHIIYAGAAPNQQIIPGTIWMMNKFGKSVYLVGSDYVFPRTANIIINDIVHAKGGEIVGERYLPLGDGSVSAIIEYIRRVKPDLILNTINGDTNQRFFKGLKEAGLKDVPIMSFSLSESEAKQMEGNALASHFVSWGYFQGNQSEENLRFVKGFKDRYGKDRCVSDPVEAAYISVRLWRQGVKDAGSEDPEEVNRTILRQSIKAPSGIISVDRSTRHLWKMALVGKINREGLIDKLWSSTFPVRPLPFPSFRVKGEWEEELLHLQNRGEMQ